MLAKNATILRLPNITLSALLSALDKEKFSEPLSLDTESRGFVPPSDDNPESLVYLVDDDVAVISYRHDKKLLPASVIRDEVKRLARKMETETGFKPGRKAMSDLKELVIADLLPKAFVQSSFTRAWIDFKANLLVVDSASTYTSEHIWFALQSHLYDCVVSPLRTTKSPATCFTHWIQHQDAPENFTTDNNALITDYDGGSIRVANYDVSSDDIRDLVENNRECVEIAMTFDNKLSFVLTESLALKRIRYNGIAVEKNDEKDDAEIILSASLIREAVADIGIALGGFVTERECE